MLPMRLFRGRGLQRDQRGEPADVPRHVRLDLPAQPVPPGRAGLLARPRRACGCCPGPPCRCSSPRSPAPLRPHRRPARHRRRPRPPGRRPRLVRRDRLRPASPTPPRSPPWSISGIGMSLYFSPGRQPGHVQRRAPTNRASPPAPTTRCARSAAPSASPCWPPSSPPSGGYECGQAFVDGLVPALWTGAAAVAPSARPPRSCCPAGAAPRPTAASASAPAERVSA